MVVLFTMEKFIKDNMITIKEPIWCMGPGVGIAIHKIPTHGNLQIQISYKDKQGNKPYPHTYTMEGKKALTYTVRAAKGNVPELRIIPIRDFTILIKEYRR